MEARRRPRPSLRVENFGPIRSADVTFGDLTVLVGPQATGKSIFLQVLKLLVDTGQVLYEFRRAGIDWEGKFDTFLNVYFGEGMDSLWRNADTRVALNGEAVRLRRLVADTRPRKRESLFFIPAQRVLVLREGWPQAFTHYDPGVPFAVREFSEELRLLMSDFGTSGTLFPVPRRLKDEFRELLQQNIFCGFDLKIDTLRAQKRLVLAAAGNGAPLPFMVWSAGQREFVPLLLGLYWLLTPAGAPRRRGVEWVVIEELEMGLHPRAIAVVLLLLFELVARGYRVCVSTHSAQVLEAVWALRLLKEHGARPEALLEVFEAPSTQPMRKLAESVLRKRAKVYYFDRKSGETENISALDPDVEEAGESGWGGLAEFSARVNRAVAHAVANSKKEMAS